MSDAGARARDRDARLRGELRAMLGRGQFGRDLLALEPLLDEFDGIEIAAAAVQLLEATRVRAPLCRRRRPRRRRRRASD